MLRALAIRKAVLLIWSVSSAMIFLAVALASGILLCMLMTATTSPELPAMESSGPSHSSNGNFGLVNLLRHSGVLPPA
jgi:hypothetical protein